ncbi:hypothetical protein AB0O64_21545 [Streptomyces sp. NPDC088341]|uniref:hypothetical protein n=1 Tax=Streptomyces sp. NPDC088341 TaxID=3154870 RepID=UPI0034358FD6
MKPRNWTTAAGLSLLAVTLTYGYGVSRMFSLDRREECTVVLHQEFDPEYAYVEERFFPLTRKCNASYDMVPSFVNPSIVLLLAGTLLCAGAAVASAVRRRRAVRLRTDSR